MVCYLFIYLLLFDCVLLFFAYLKIPIKILKIVDASAGSGFKPLITDAVVSLVGSDKRVPIKLFRDTSAKHLFIIIITY